MNCSRTALHLPAHSALHLPAHSALHLSAHSALQLDSPMRRNPLFHRLTALIPSHQTILCLFSDFRLSSAPHSGCYSDDVHSQWNIPLGIDSQRMFLLPNLPRTDFFPIQNTCFPDYSVLQLSVYSLPHIPAHCSISLPHHKPPGQTDEGSVYS